MSYTSLGAKNLNSFYLLIPKFAPPNKNPGKLGDRKEKGFEDPVWKSV